MATTWADILWGKKANVKYLLIAAVFLLFTLLGSREIWTQEHRWADIVAGMFFRHDFLHPYLGQTNYYDKPLLSYWLMAGLSYLNGAISLWTLRLPSVFAGLLSLWSIYRIGTKLKNSQLGIVSGWLLLTTFYFVFWSKTSSADMLNMAGTLFAVSWYLDNKDHPSFFTYAVFFIIVALTSLCKGLIGAVVPVLAILPDIVKNGEWKKHLRLSFFAALIPGLLIYLFPFIASSYFGGEDYAQNGLYLVYKENILRYFQPFDHKGPIYTYFVFLPVYLLPWAFFFIPALFSLKSRWKMMSDNSRWLVWVVGILFLFLTLSGSRRNYYVLPLVPFAILLTADWILSAKEQSSKRYVWAGRVAVAFFGLLFLFFNVIQPLYYSQGGITTFAAILKQELRQTPNISRQIVLLDGDNKAKFYLNLPPNTKEYSLDGDRDDQTVQSLKAAWPALSAAHANAIFITRKRFEPLVRQILVGYRVVETPRNLGEKVLSKVNLEAPVAFIPA